jgi:hypothetical protein
MISPSYDIREFIHEVEDRDYEDIILMADREATVAGCLLYHPRSKEEARRKGAKEYATALENFIFYLRYGVKRYGVSEGVFELYRCVCEKLVKRRPSYTRCMTGHEHLN